MLSFKSFSQTDTTSTTIQLSKPIAKLVVTDLISGDQAKIEVKTLGELISELEKKNTTSLNIIENLETQNKNFSLMINDYKEKSETQAQLSEDLQKALKRQKRQTTIYKIGSTVGLAATVLLLIQ
tara:strand:+ start:318 stop:692 length:375 start_codon:yes stop_codon:yes gene_type:complete